MCLALSSVVFIVCHSVLDKRKIRCVSVSLDYMCNTHGYIVKERDNAICLLRPLSTLDLRACSCLSVCVRLHVSVCVCVHVLVCKMSKWCVGVFSVWSQHNCVQLYMWQRSTYSCVHRMIYLAPSFSFEVRWKLYSFYDLCKRNHFLPFYMKWSCGVEIRNIKSKIKIKKTVWQNHSLNPSILTWFDLKLLLIKSINIFQMFAIHKISVMWCQ